VRDFEVILNYGPYFQLKQCKTQ